MTGSAYLPPFSPEERQAHARRPPSSDVGEVRPAGGDEPAVAAVAPVSSAPDGPTYADFLGDQVDD